MMTPRRRVILASLLLAAVAAPATMHGQTASLAGTVTRDSAAAPVVGARVQLPRLGHEAVTDARGQFRLDGLPAGTFEILISAVDLAERDPLALRELRAQADGLFLKLAYQFRR